MNRVYIVQENVDTWAENGGGDFLIQIFANKETANDYCE